MNEKGEKSTWFSKYFSNPDGKGTDIGKVLTILWVFSTTGMISMLFPTLAQYLNHGWAAAVQCLGACLLMGGASIVAGTMVGFLFGVPKTNKEAVEKDTNAAATYVPNTNLELISDWLTKIIVGIGLIQFSEIVESVRQLGEFCGPIFGVYPLGNITAIAIVLHYSTIGFIQGFLLAYLWLPRAFRRANEKEA